MNQQHTPGPWEFVVTPHNREWSYWIVPKDETFRTVAAITRTEATGYDARLIAAAPDLLAACEEVIWRWTFNQSQEHTHTWHDWADCVVKLKAAIAKATGG